LIVSGFVTK